MVTERSVWVSCPRDIRGVTSEKHMTRGLVWVLLDVSDELHDGTSHEVTLVNLVTVTDGGHVFLEGQRHPQGGQITQFLTLYF